MFQGVCWQVDTKPASDILAGAVARAASQGTIHPLDTLKVRMQAQGGLSKYAKLVPPPGAQINCILVLHHPHIILHH